MDFLIRALPLVLFLFLIILIRLFPQSEQSENPALVQSWRRGFFLVFVISTLLALIVDPRGYFGTDIFPTRSMPDRRDKLQFYAALDAPPDVLLFSSSRGRNISAEAMSRIAGLRFFNAALTGGRVGEAPVLLAYAHSLEQHGHQLPSVILIEILPDVSAESTIRSDLWPLAYLRYMPPAMQARAIQARMLSPFSINVLSEATQSLYVHLLFPSLSPDVVFTGEGIDTVRHFTESQLNEVIQKKIDEEQNATFCDRVDSDIQSAVESVRRMADIGNSSIVFYFSPLQPRYYNEALATNESYQACYAAYTDYFRTQADHSESVYFIDLLHPEGIEAFSTPEYFYDQWHFNPIFGEWLIAQLTPTLQAAYESALQRRETP